MGLCLRCGAARTQCPLTSASNSTSEPTEIHSVHNSPEMHWASERNTLITVMYFPFKSCVGTHDSARLCVWYRYTILIYLCATQTACDFSFCLSFPTLTSCGLLKVTAVNRRECKAQSWRSQWQHCEWVLCAPSFEIWREATVNGAPSEASKEQTNENSYFLFAMRRRRRRRPDTGTQRQHVFCALKPIEIPVQRRR